MERVQILVVEDEGVVARDIQRTLENLGHDVPWVASSAEEAMRISSEQHPSLVLMDIVLQGEMDGMEAAEYIRTHLDIPVVYLTAYADDRVLQRAKVTEPFGYILKPFQERELHSVIETALYKHQMERKLRESERFSTSLLLNSAGPIVVLSPDTSVRYVNPALEALTGFTAGELFGRKAPYPWWTEETLEKTRRDLSEAMQEGATHLEELFQKKSGERFWVEIRSQPVTTEGRLEYYLATWADITERKRTNEFLEKLFVQLAETISTAMAYRDPYTAGHGRRVGELARLVGGKLGLDEGRSKGLYVAGLLHDIGNLSVPEDLLIKRGRMNPEELALLRAHHTRGGYEILSGVEFPWPVADVALHHHERIDGSGYPDGLRGDELSLEVQIVGVCDTVDEMNSSGIYHAARSKKEMLAELTRGRGATYGVDVADAMTGIIRSGELDRVSAE